VLFQPEARGDGEGAAVQTVPDGETVHTEENVETHPHNDMQLENVEGDNGNDKTEV
jgi:hypothetical protein